MILAFPIDTSGKFHTGVTHTEFPDRGQSCGPIEEEEANGEGEGGDSEPEEQTLGGPLFKPFCSNNSMGQVLYSKESTPTYDQVLKYIHNVTGNQAFLEDFATSFSKMMAVGYGEGGKLGTLTLFDLNSCVVTSADTESASASSDNDATYRYYVLVPVAVGSALFGVFLAVAIGYYYSTMQKGYQSAVNIVDDKAPEEANNHVVGANEVSDTV